MKRAVFWIGLALALGLLLFYGMVPGGQPRLLLGNLLHRTWLAGPPAKSGFAPEPESAADAARRRARGKAWAQWYRSRRNNVFSSPQAARQDVALAGLPLLDDLEVYLNDPSELAALPEHTQMLRSHPSVVLERMAALDIVELLATSDADPTVPADALVERAQDLLEQRVLAAPDDHDPSVVRGVRRAEQHDALLALMHVNSRRGLDLYASLNPHSAQFLQSAVMLALIDLGMPESEALRAAQEAHP